MNEVEKRVWIRGRNAPGIDMHAQVVTRGAIFSRRNGRDNTVPSIIFSRRHRHAALSADLSICMIKTSLLSALNFSKSPTRVSSRSISHWWREKHSEKFGKHVINTIFWDLFIRDASFTNRPIKLLPNLHAPTWISRVYFPPSSLGSVSLPRTIIIANSTHTHMCVHACHYMQAAEQMVGSFLLLLPLSLHICACADPQKWGGKFWLKCKSFRTVMFRASISTARSRRVTFFLRICLAWNGSLLCAGKANKPDLCVNWEAVGCDRVTPSCSLNANFTACLLIGPHVVGPAGDLLAL